MSGYRLPGAGAGLRVGLFGNLGSGNIGNDASLEAMLKYLAADQPGAVLDAMCAGPQTVKYRYGVPAITLRWLPPGKRRAATGMVAAARKSVSKAVDTVRIASWVRRHDVVIVPGMGVLETTLPLRPWGSPTTCHALPSGRVFRTKVALVSVGANVSASG